MSKVYSIHTFKSLSSAKRYLALLMSIFVLYSIYTLFISSNEKRTEIPAPVSTCSDFKPVVKFYGIKDYDEILDVVKDLFIAIGYRFHTNEFMEWDVLWSYTYPFYDLEKEMRNLKPHQKINHFPGSGFITQKSALASLNIDNIPRSFILPDGKEDFLGFAKKNPGKPWIMKSSTHRDMKLISGTIPSDVKDAFIQEYINSPLLISGKKFDVGVYVILTSIDPLRVYVYSEDVLLRFCTKNYYPLDANSPESYIVGEDYLPIWEVDHLKFYYSELNYTAKESLNAYLQKKGESTKKLWHQIHKIIQDVYLHTEDDLKGKTLTFGTLRNFFELVRFDFIIDKDMNVFLLEVNMSPNLSPAHFPQNKLLYQQIVFSSLSIVGLVRKFHDSYFYRGAAEVSEKDIQVFSEQCASETCQFSCKSFKCSICNQCMNVELKNVAKSAYLEFLNREKYRRVLPQPVIQDDQRQFKSVQLSGMNAFMDLWFRGKCQQDLAWCH